MRHQRDRIAAHDVNAPPPPRGMTVSGYTPSTTAQVVAAGIILRRQTSAGDRWLMLKARKHGEWGFPKGHQERGETPLQTALRECVEECGIALLAVEGLPLECCYRLPDGRGKTVVYFPAITAQTDIDLSDEHSDHAWFSAREVMKRLDHDNLVLLYQAYRHALERGSC
jgi:8-oxo-dGTP pyrophosphatase MutT (NUDIX family)